MDIPKVDTWFFEKLDFQYPDVLSIKLVEGIKSDSKEYILEDTDNPLGPYFPVTVQPNSKCIRVLFRDVLSFQVVDESLSSPMSDIDLIRYIGPIKQTKSLKYQEYIEQDSIITQTREGEYSSYYLWTEDQTISVITTSEPEAIISDETPNISLERCNTYFSN